MLKKMLSFILIVILSFTLFACTNESSTNDVSTTDDSFTNISDIVFTNPLIDHPSLPELGHFYFQDLFHDGLMLVKNDEGLYGYMNSSGHMVIDFKYTQASHFMNGTAIVSEDYKYGIIDTEGNYYVEDKYNYISSIENTYNYLLFYEYTVIHFNILTQEAKLLGNDLTGKYLNSHIEYTYFPIYNKADKCALFDNEGNQYTDFEYDRIEKKQIGERTDIFYARKDELFGYINLQNDVLIDFQYTHVKAFNEFGVASVGTTTNYLIDLEGHELTNPNSIYREVQFNSEGIGFVTVSYGVGFEQDTVKLINSRGETVQNEPYFKQAENKFDEDTFIIEAKNDQGEKIINYYDDLGNLSFTYLKEDVFVNGYDVAIVRDRDEGALKVIDYSNNKILGSDSFNLFLNRTPKVTIIFEELSVNETLNATEVNVYLSDGTKINTESYLIPYKRHDLFYYIDHYSVETNGEYFAFWETDLSKMVVIDREGNVMFSGAYEMSFQSTKIYSDNYVRVKYLGNDVLFDINGNFINQGLTYYNWNYII